MYITIVRFSDEADSDVECTEYKPVVCLGWQPGSNIFVIGEDLQFTDTGDIIPKEQQQFIYIPQIMEKLGMTRNVLKALPTTENPLKDLIGGFYEVAGDGNKACALFCLGKLIIMQD